MEIQGKLIEKFAATTHGESFKKQEFVIETLDDKYPQTIKMQSTQDKIEKIDALKLGGQYTFHFNLRGRKWESPENKIVYFSTIDVWRVEPMEQSIPEVKQTVKTETRLSDDLPF